MCTCDCLLSQLWRQILNQIRAEPQLTQRGHVLYAGRQLLDLIIFHRKRAELAPDRVIRERQTCQPIETHVKMFQIGQHVGIVTKQVVVRVQLSQSGHAFDLSVQKGRKTLLEEKNATYHQLKGVKRIVTFS